MSLCIGEFTCTCFPQLNYCIALKAHESVVQKGIYKSSCSNNSDNTTVVCCCTILEFILETCCYCLIGLTTVSIIVASANLLHSSSDGNGRTALLLLGEEHKRKSWIFRIHAWVIHPLSLGLWALCCEQFLEALERDLTTKEVQKVWQRMHVRAAKQGDYWMFASWCPFSCACVSETCSQSISIIGIYILLFLLLPCKKSCRYNIFLLLLFWQPYILIHKEIIMNR